jgi:phospholipid transport system substrate-binding protein
VASARRSPATIFFLLILAAVGGLPRAARAQETGAPATAKSLCDALIGAMKQGSSMDFAARRDLLAPEIQRDFDLAFMTRIVVGPPWRSLAEGDRQGLVTAFSAYSIATYAQRFKSYSGERFEVDPSPTPQASGDCIVHTKLFTSDPSPVQLDYLMRKSGGQWRIIDVYLNGTISEVAARRSEYSTVLRQGGAPALIDLLTKKAADFGSQRPGSS